MKRCIVIAGPNGAGKSTFAQAYLPHEANCPHFVNVDLIAAGLSPFRPEAAGVEAAKLALRRLEALAEAGETFAFETTMSGLGYVKRIQHWKTLGYEIVIYFLKLAHAEVSIHRVEQRIIEGGHSVPEADIIRRFDRCHHNFEHHYKKLADSWYLYDASSKELRLLAKFP